mgnify:CR=1 FL=1
MTKFHIKTNRTFTFLRRNAWLVAGCMVLGVALAWPMDGGEPSELLDRADKALYRAKALGRGRIAVFGEDILGGPQDG